VSGQPSLRRPSWHPAALLRALLAWRGLIAAPLGPDWQSEITILRETRRLVPLLLTDAAALHIVICVRAARRLSGVMAEAGVLMGGSARLIGATKGHVPLHLFDVFETLQAEGGTSAPDAAGLQRQFGTTHGRQADVARLLEDYPPVHFHPGLFPGTAQGLEHLRFSLVHLDMDLAQSTRDGLEYFHPRLVPGGILLGDDYQDREVRAVFAGYFANRSDTYIELPWGQIMIVRRA
jgi:O-methyltransferase